MKPPLPVTASFLPRIRGLLFLLLLAACFYACNKFELSPYQTTVDPDLPLELNRLNLEKLQRSELNGDDTIRVIFTGDSQRFYNDVERLVDYVNTLPRIDFLVIAGDISDFGLRKEFEWIYRHLNRLNTPYICVVGNHDLTANGPALYGKIFGEKNFSFTHKGWKFIVHDTNGREYGFNGNVPDLEWLKQQTSDTGIYMAGISHVPPFNEDFDPSLSRPYSSLLGSRPHFLLSLHGHIHHRADSFKYKDHVRYIVTPTVSKRNAYLLKLHRGTVLAETIWF